MNDLCEILYLFSLYLFLCISLPPQIINIVLRLVLPSTCNSFLVLTCELLMCSSTNLPDDLLIVCFCLLATHPNRLIQTTIVWFCFYCYLVPAQEDVFGLFVQFSKVSLTYYNK